MLITRLISWNVNGIRAADKKGLYRWFQSESPDILCLQEIKADLSQLPPHLKNTPGYYSYYNPAARRGYSGVAVFTKYKPIMVKTGFGIKEFDSEGRILIMEYPRFTLFNIYFPNGKQNQERLDYKLRFYDAFLDYVDRVKKEGSDIIVCGDFNTAHRAIDLARPRENEKISGFLPVERAWIDRFIEHGYIDTFRYFHSDEQGAYTWWDIKSHARERNVGWRIDYFFVNKEFISNVKSSFILKDVQGSDHCPVGITLKK
ncbi:MAG: exodeoxyribonuclease III [Candidatus Thermoplasmatota archaeon]